MTNLQRHQKALSFNIWEAEVNATWISIHISIPYNMFHLSVDAVDQPIWQLFDSNMVPLKVIRQNQNDEI